MWGTQINSDLLNLRGQILFNPTGRHAVLLSRKGGNRDTTFSRMLKQSDFMDFSTNGVGCSFFHIAFDVYTGQ